jgi:ABC-type glutathione transport system ATPase component
MVFQDPMSTLNSVLKVSDQMQLALQAHGNPDHAEMRRRCIEALAKVGIPTRSAGSMHIRMSYRVACGSA